MALPGVNTTINDGGLRIRRTISGERVLLMGNTDNTALTLNEPAVVQDSVIAMQACRATDGSETELSLGLADALRGGAEFIEVMKIGSSTNISYSGYTTEQKFLDLSGAYEALEGHETSIVVPLGVYAEDAIGNTYVSSGFFTGGIYAQENFAEQLAQFCYRQTADFNSTVGVIPVKPPSLSPVSGSSVYRDIGHQTDTGYYFDTPSRTVVSNWASYLTGGFSNNLAYSPKWLSYLSGSTESYASSYLADWQAKNSDGISQTDDLGNKVDVGAYISVFAAPVRTFGSAARKFAGEVSASTSSTNYNSPGAAAYAGLISSLPPHIATTNKTVPGLLSSRSVSRTEAESLRDNRMVAMMDRTRGHVVVEDVSGAYFVDKYTRSDFHRLTTVRITHAAAQGVREAMESFIGEPINSPQLNAMREAVENRLRTMTLSGALRRYSFDIIATPDQQSLGEATINLEIVPAFELVNVNTSVRLAKE
jgi:hypothetical protein